MADYTLMIKKINKLEDIALEIICNKTYREKKKTKSKMNRVLVSW